MITIKNARVLCGDDMKVRKTNIIIEDHEILELTDNIVKGKVIDGQNCVASPTLINSHVHIGDSVAMDVGDGEPIDKIVKPPNGIKHRILEETKPSEMVNAMQNSMNTMLQTGTTTFVDFREGGFKGIELLETASKNVPIRKIVLGRHESFHDSENLSEIRVNTEEILEHCNGIGLSGYGEIKDEITSLIVDICKEHGKLAAIHVAEYLELQNSL